MWEPNFEGLLLVFHVLRSDIPSGRQHMLVPAYLLDHRALAEPGHVFVRARSLVAAPRVIRSRDARDVLVGQLALRAVDHAAQLAGVDEQHLAATIAETV